MINTEKREQVQKQIYSVSLLYSNTTALHEVNV